MKKSISSRKNDNQTFSLRAGEIERNWHLVDAKNKILGRLATEIAKKLMGKHKPYFSYHLDCGDYVVVINAEKIMTTGRKENQKIYYHYSGYPGGLKETKLKDLRERHPERIIFNAVSGMLPKNKLRKKRLGRLKIVVGENHQYADKLKAKEEKNA